MRFPRPTSKGYLVSRKKKSAVLAASLGPRLMVHMMSSPTVATLTAGAIAALSLATPAAAGVETHAIPPARAALPARIWGPAWCAPYWQVWNSDQMCGTVYNMPGSAQMITLVKHWPDESRSWIRPWEINQWTYLSPGYEFGGPQGYDVDGFCVWPGYKALVNRSMYMNGNWCFKIRGGSHYSVHVVQGEVWW